MKNEDTYHQNCQFVIMGFEQKYDKKNPMALGSFNFQHLDCKFRN
jgi:hypothetical protein